MTKVRIDGDGRGGVKAFDDLSRAVAKADDVLEDTTLSAKQLEKAAGRIAKQNESPLDRYNRKIAELALLMKQGKLSVDDAQAAALRYQRSLDRAGDAGKRAFGASALSDLKSFALQFASVNYAIGMTTQGLQELSAERERARQAALQARAGVGELAQLAATEADPEAAYKRMLKEARGIRASGAADNQQEAANILFSLLSAGLSDSDRKFAIDLKSTGVLNDVGGTATAYAALTKALGKQEVGSFADVVSKALAASSAAPALANEIPQAATRAGGSARALGISDEFLLAATAILAAKTGEASQGGTQLAAFLKGIERKGLGASPELAGLSGIDLVKAIAAGDQSRSTLAGLLGDKQEGIEGFRTLRDNLPELVALLAKIEKAQSDGLAARAQGLPLTDAVAATALAEAQAKGTLEVALGPQSSLASLVRSAFDESRAARGGGGGFSDFTRNRQLGLYELLGGVTENQAANLIGQVAGGLQNSQNTALLEQIRERLGDLDERLRTIGQNQTSRTAVSAE